MPLGFATGQSSASDNQAQAISCSVHPSSDRRCADVVLDLRRTDRWRIVAVRYDGFQADHVEHLRLPEDVELPEQLESLRITIPDDVNHWRQ